MGPEEGEPLPKHVAMVEQCQGGCELSPRVQVPQTGGFLAKEGRGGWRRHRSTQCHPQVPAGHERGPDTMGEGPAGCPQLQSCGKISTDMG